MVERCALAAAFAPPGTERKWQQRRVQRQKLLLNSISSRNASRDAYVGWLHFRAGDSTSPPRGSAFHLELLGGLGTGKKNKWRTGTRFSIRCLHRLVQSARLLLPLKDEPRAEEKQREGAGGSLRKQKGLVSWDRETRRNSEMEDRLISDIEDTRWKLTLRCLLPFFYVSLFVSTVLAHTRTHTTTLTTVQRYSNRV